MNEREKIIDKIKKCLALTSSSNEHEAATALRQAEKLMEQHGVSDLDMQAAEANEKRARSGYCSVRARTRVQSTSSTGSGAANRAPRRAAPTCSARAGCAP